MTYHQQSQEDSRLIDRDVGKYLDNIHQLELATDTSSVPVSTIVPCWPKRTLIGRVSAAIVIFLSIFLPLRLRATHEGRKVEQGRGLVPTGPYRLLEAHEGRDFFSYYSFYNGSDSLGSAGFNTYVSQSKAEELGIVDIVTGENDDAMIVTKEELVYLSSAPTKDGPRYSIRLEGKRRFERGLFILDVRHMPDGCGVWPAFWLTDEDAWPWNGEIDVLEGRHTFCFTLIAHFSSYISFMIIVTGVNGQTTAKTALHTSNECDMYAHVAPYAKTGDWEWISKFVSFVVKLYCVNFTNG